jgi:hypothetical protein
MFTGRSCELAGVGINLQVIQDFLDVNVPRNA